MSTGAGLTAAVFRPSCWTTPTPGPTRLWRSALGSTGREAKAPTYYELGEVAGVDVVLQRTGGGEAGAHLDIETDDLEADVRRLQEAGAVVVDHVEDHVVMRDPGGLQLCFVPVTDRDRFERSATSLHLK